MKDETSLFPYPVGCQQHETLSYNIFIFLSLKIIKNKIEIICKHKNGITCILFCLLTQTKRELTSELYKLNNKLIKHRKQTKSLLKRNEKIKSERDDEEFVIG